MNLPFVFSRPQGAAPSLLRAAVATTGLGLLLAACGGGGGGGHLDQGLSQSQAESDAGNGSQLPNHSAGALDNVFDTTQLVATAAGTLGTVDGAVVACPGGGTATITVTGGTSESRLNGQFDTGEHDTLQFAQCRGAADFAQLDGTVDIDVISAADTGTGRAVQLALSLQSLQVTLSLGTLSLDGQADLSRTLVDGAAGATTTTSELTATALTAATTFNHRAARFDLADVDLTRIVDKVGGVTTDSSLAGQLTLSGTAGGFHFSDVQIATDGATTYDADGHPVAGAWTAVHGATTVYVTLADGIVTVKLDRGSDGTIERTWTFALQHLLDEEG